MTEAILNDLAAQAADTDSPIYVRLAAAILRQIVLCAAKDGAPLPSVRYLAKTASLNHKTVAAAYGLLVKQGVVVTSKWRPPRLASAACAHEQLALAAQRRRALGDFLDLAALEAVS